MKNIIFLIKTFFLIWFAFRESTFFHELGHFIVARRYDKGVYGKIILKYATPFFKVKNCIFVKDRNLSARGRTDLSNNYINYTNQQLKWIAINGANFGAISIVVFGILTEVFSKMAIRFYRGCYACSDGFMFMTLLLALVWSYGNFFLSSDFWIFRNPTLYRERCKMLAKKL